MSFLMTGGAAYIVYRAFTETAKYIDKKLSEKKSKK